MKTKPVRMLIFEVKFQKKSVNYTQWVNSFICDILYIIHSSNLVLRSEGWVCIFSGRYM